MLLLLKCSLTAVRRLLRPRGDLVLENLALRHQLEVLTRNSSRPMLQPTDRLLWSWLSRLWPEWRRHIVIVRPDTVVRWHRWAGVAIGRGGAAGEAPVVRGSILSSPN